MDLRQVLPQGLVLDGKYRIERVIGAGGFGITYAAHDLGLNTTVALKEYYPSDFGVRDRTMSVRARSANEKDMFERLRVSFVREARTLAKFRHPSIVRVFSVFEAHGTAYMVMEYEEGRSFKQWMRGLGRAPTQAELDHIFMPLIDALEVLHNASFLHRDIAPDNIIIREDGSPVLLDFGAARRVQSERSQMTGLVKQGYSPQEQYTTDGKQQGPWTDIYALAATLYHAVMGVAPAEATARFIDDTTRPAVEAEGEWRRGFLEGIDRSLAVRPESRPQSIAELRPLLFGDSPERARVPTRPYPPLPASQPEATAIAAAPTIATPSPAAISSVDAFERLPGLPVAAQAQRGTSSTMLRVGVVATVLAVSAFGVYQYQGRTNLAEVVQRTALGGSSSTPAESQGDSSEQARRALEAAERARAEAQEEVRRTREQREALLRDEQARVQRDEQARRERDRAEQQRQEQTRREQEARSRADERTRLSDEAFREAVRLIGGTGGSVDQARARALFEAAAAAGRVDAMNWLGRIYLNGLGVVQDPAKSVEWFERAANAGDVASMAQLGLLYQNGQGVAQDYTRAKDWFERAGNAGHAQSLHYLGNMYHNGVGVLQDVARARDLYERAAIAGNVQSMLNLAHIYRQGVGIAADPVKAREWYEKAAANGHSAAMNQLGVIYQDGSGVARDPAAARGWYERAVSAGNTIAMYNLARLLNTTQGGAADYPRAAKLLLTAAQARVDVAMRELTGNMARWSRQTRTELKTELQRQGVYSGAINDTWDDAARKAVNDLRAQARGR